MYYEIIIQSLWFILPAYVANASALLVGGGLPLDFGKYWKDNRRILGDGKTWRGLFSGAFIGMTVGFGLSAAAKYINTTDFAWLGLNDFMGFPLMIPLIFSLCFGALLGDITESFFKRRVGKKRGEDWLIFDQLDFIIGALSFSLLISTLLMISGLVAFNWFFASFSLWHILVLLTFTPFFHLFANFVHRKAAHKAIPEKVK
jgi:CDP-2,3-bis-(O-geranylgeranyl)-sn-glycerol synthase